jgi:hypothetical protein
MRHKFNCDQKMNVRRIVLILTLLPIALHATVTCRNCRTNAHGENECNRNCSGDFCLTFVEIFNVDGREKRQTTSAQTIDGCVSGVDYITDIMKSTNGRMQCFARHDGHVCLCNDSNLCNNNAHLFAEQIVDEMSDVSTEESLAPNRTNHTHMKTQPQATQHMCQGRNKSIECPLHQCYYKRESYMTSPGECRHPILR